MDRLKGLVRRRTKLATTHDKKISDDEFMAAAIGDVEWLRQSLRSKGGNISYDKNVSTLFNEVLLLFHVVYCVAKDRTYRSYHHKFFVPCTSLVTF